MLTIVAFAYAMCNNIMRAESMDRDWCYTLLEIKDTVAVPDSVAEPMSEQCSIFQNEAKKAINTICKMEGTEARRAAADRFNHQNKDDYNIYIQMVRALREYMERKCLGATATSMCYDVVKTNAEIDAMFTVFRSGRSLPKNKYTENID